MADAQSISKKTQIFATMQKQEAILDKILLEQAILHSLVREKNWSPLKNCLEKLDKLSDEFSLAEKEREKLCLDFEIAQDGDFVPILTRLRGKLIKSKNENEALRRYLNAVCEFLNGVFDEVIPSRKNLTYGRDGLLKKAEVKSLVLNKVT